MFLIISIQCDTDHVGCVKKQRHVKLETYPNGTWFCSTQCEKVLGLVFLLDFLLAQEVLFW